MFILLLLFISILVHSVWFFKKGILNYGDWIFLHDEIVKSMIKDHSVWMNYKWLGQFFILPMNNLFYYLMNLFAIASLEYNTIVKLIFLFPIAIMAPLGMFFLAKKLTKNNFASFISALFYSFNTFFLRLQLDWQTHAFVWALMPIIYLTYLKLIEKSTIKYSIILALISTISIAYEPRISIVVFGVIGIDFIARIFLFKEIRKIRVFYALFLTTILIILLNMFWFILSFAPLQDVVFKSPHESVFVNFYTLFDSFTVHHYTWCKNLVCVPFKNNLPQTVLFIFAIFAFLAFLVKTKNERYNKLIFIFGIIALIGVFLSKQQGKPFGFVYEWLFYNAPLFNIYREASKFFIIHGFAMSILLAFFVDMLLNRKKYEKQIKVGFIIIFLLMFGLNMFNVATGKVGGMFKPREINPDYYAIKKLTLSNEFYRTLWIPRINRFSYFDFNRPAISQVSTLQTDWNEFSNFRSINYAWPQGNQIVGVLSNNFSDFLLDSASIRYVFIPSDEYDEIYKHYGNKSYFEQAVFNLSYLKKLDWELKNVSVYENKGYYPHIYSPDSVYLINFSDLNKVSFIENNKNAFLVLNETTPKIIKALKEVNYGESDLFFEMINPTKYIITVRNTTKPFFIVFSEAYHPEWKLYVNDLGIGESWIKAFYNEGESPFKINGWANGYYIDECNTECTITLYFKPQSYFYLGLIISGTTLIACIGYLIYDWRKNKKKNKYEKYTLNNTES